MVINMRRKESTDSVLWFGAVENRARRVDFSINRSRPPEPMPALWRPTLEGAKFARLVGMSMPELVEQVATFKQVHIAKGSSSPNWQALWLAWCRRWADDRRGKLPRRPARPGSSDGDEHEPMTFRDFARRHGFSDHIKAICQEIGHREALDEQAWSKFVFEQCKRPPAIGRRWPAIFREHLRARRRGC